MATALQAIIYQLLVNKVLQDKHHLELHAQSGVVTGLHERVSAMGQAHLDGNPDIWTEFLAYELRRQFRKQERAIEDCHSIVVVSGCYMEILCMVHQHPK